MHGGRTMDLKASKLGEARGWENLKTWIFSFYTMRRPPCTWPRAQLQKHQSHSQPIYRMRRQDFVLFMRPG